MARRATPSPRRHIPDGGEHRGDGGGGAGGRGGRRKLLIGVAVALAALGLGGWLVTRSADDGGNTSATSTASTGQTGSTTPSSSVSTAPTEASTVATPASSVSISPVVDGTLVGAIDPAGDFYAKDGLAGTWTLQMDGAKAIASAVTGSA